MTSEKRKILQKEVEVLYTALPDLVRIEILHSFGMSSSGLERINFLKLWHLTPVKLATKIIEFNAMLSLTFQVSPELNKFIQSGKQTPAGAVEEDGDEIFTPVPKTCQLWRRIFIGSTFNDGPCKGTIRAVDGFMLCTRCHVSYGPVKA